MPPSSLVKKTRSRLSDVQRKEICCYHKDHPFAKQQDIADEFQIRYPNLSLDRSTVSKVLSKKDHYLHLETTNQSQRVFRHRQLKYPALELAMNYWIGQINASGLILTELLIKEKGKVFAAGLGISEQELLFSNGWIEKFKQRHNLHKVIMHGEAASAPLESLPAERRRLQEVISNFDPEDVFNADETELFYRMMPNHTLATKPTPGKKMDKAILTVLLAANSTGTEKLDPLVIGHAKRPRCFSGINISQLPITYQYNSKAWMRMDIWEQWLRHIDAGFHITGQQILLLVDNAPSHTTVAADDNHDNVNETHVESEDDEPPTNCSSDSSESETEVETRTRGRGRPHGRPRGRPRSNRNSDSRGNNPSTPRRPLELTNVTIHYLPPNTTAHIQPMDAGIIKNFKAKYKRLYCQHLLSQFERNEEIEK